MTARGVGGVDVAGQDFYACHDLLQNPPPRTLPYKSVLGSNEIKVGTRKELVFESNVDLM